MNRVFESILQIPNKFLFLMFFLFIAFCFNSNALTVSPSTIVIETESGIPKNAVVKVINDSKRDQTLTVSIEDLFFDKNGNKKSRPVSPKNINSIARYIEPSVRKTIIKAGEIKDVDLIFNMPSEIIGGNSAMANFQVIPKTPNGLKAGFVMSTILGVTILQETKGTGETKSRISEVTIKRIEPDEPLSFEMKVINQGNTFLKTGGVVSIFDYEDHFLGSFDLGKKVIPPKNESKFKQNLMLNLKPGKYYALITYQYKDKSISINKVFEIK